MPWKATSVTDQRVKFMLDYNERVRTGQTTMLALCQTPPARSYERSSREYPKRLPEIEYPSSFELRRVRSSGEIKWKGQSFFLSESLVGEYVAFEDIDDGCSIIHFGPLELGYHSEREHKLYLDRSRPEQPATASNQQPDKQSPHIAFARRPACRLPRSLKGRHPLLVGGGGKALASLLRQRKLSNTNLRPPCRCYLCSRLHSRRRMRGVS